MVGMTSRGLTSKRGRSKKGGKETDRKSSKLKRRTVVLLVGLSVLIVVVLLALTGPALVVKLGMQTYLKDKYGDSFVVEHPKHTDGGLAVPGLWRAIAYPAEDTTVKFEVTQSQSTSQYEDSYSGAVWSKDQESQFLGFLKTLYDTPPKYEIDTHLITVGPDPVRGKIPPFDEAVKSFGTQMTYSATIKFSSPDLTDADKQYHREKVKEIAKYVQQKGVASPSVRYVININDEDAGYICDLYKDALSDSVQIDKCFDTKSRGKVW